MGAMDLVKKNAIYLYGKDRKSIAWTGIEYGDGFLDRHSCGTLYTKEDIKENFKEEITLEEAILKNLITEYRFMRMRHFDKEVVVKAMLKLKGIIPTLNFLSQVNLHLSEEDLVQVSKT